MPSKVKTPVNDKDSNIMIVAQPLIVLLKKKVNTVYITDINEIVIKNRANNIEIFLPKLVKIINKSVAKSIFFNDKVLLLDLSFEAYSINSCLRPELQ